MFNRSPFNRMSYNRPFSIEIYLHSTLHGNGELTASLNLELALSSQLDGIGELIASYIREIAFAVQLSGEGTLDVDVIRERLMSVQLDGNGELRGTLSRFHVTYLEYTGDFDPGDKIVIDSNRMTIKKNGVNVIHEMDGDFFDLNFGENELIYKDEESGRSILIRVTHRDKFLY